MFPELGDRTNHCRRVLARGRGFNFFGKHFFHAEIAVGRRADSEITTPSTASNAVFLQMSRKPKDKKTASEENKQFDPGGKGGEPPPWKAGVPVFFFFWGNSGPGCPLLGFCAFVFACLSVAFCSYQVIIFLRSEENTGRRKPMKSVTGGQASSCPLTPRRWRRSTHPGSMYLNALGMG